ncbi:hypothetical protein PIGHUM_01444 [Pigmentiphaga humi]|uniref:Lipoprotein n=1 Tax=Pigmentiphaga humi TaxID=2478468 RepID=A0A3P4B017_9BURK|nr:hypothetical protein [Pigmentiphaga humi]VCU69382.1 hypothetical protein PIGHUM_01444 [Pigmentiphaga humi]
MGFRLGTLCVGMALVAGCAAVPGRPGPAGAQGFWRGEIADARTQFAMMVAPDGQVWGFYWPDDAVSIYQFGMVHAASTVQGATFRAAGRDYRPGGAVADGEATATLSGATMAGQVGGMRFAAGYSALYEQPAPFGLLAGKSWLFTDNTGSSGRFRIDANGRVWGVSRGEAGSCRFGGMVVPQAARYYFDLALIFDDSAACPLRAQAVAGVMVYDDGILEIGMLPGDRSRGLIALATRDVD